MDLKLERVLSPLLGESTGQVWLYLADLLGAPIPPQYEQSVKQLSATQLDTKINNAIQQTIEALAAERPSVLSFDDLHWADQSSLALIESLMLSTWKSPSLIILS